MKTSTPKVTLTGSKKDGYVLSLHNPEDKFKWDVQLVESELKMIAEAIIKKLK